MNIIYPVLNLSCSCW